MKPDLDIAKPVVINMLQDNAYLATVYRTLRAQTRFSGIGDYVLCSFIIHEAKEASRGITNKQVSKLLRQCVDKEFNRVRATDEIVRVLNESD